MISVRDALALWKPTDEERRLITTIEVTVDDSIAREYSGGKMAGAPIRLDVQQNVDPKIAYAVARNYESKGGWRVGVLAVAPLSLQFVPFTVPEAVARQADVKTLPPVVHIEAPAKVATKRLLVRMPTRSRPKQALDVLALYRSMAGIPIQIEVVIDEDDETMMTAPVLQRLNALGCVVTVGRHRSKIEAVNAGRVTDWDVLLLASDDMVPIAGDYAVRVLEAMERHWPQLDGAIYQNDGFQGDNLVTLPIMGRRFYDLFGYVYHPDYRSLFSDTEQQRLWMALDRLRYVDEKWIEHRHPLAGKAAPDALYVRNEGWDADRATMDRREATRQERAQFGFDSPPLWLSVCIATLPSRRPQLDLLVTELYRQRDALDEPRAVEIVIDADHGNVGEKRQRLLERAKGHYVAFVDDDDMVSHSYLARIVSACAESPSVDCVAIAGTMTTAGNVPETFVHALGLEWGYRNGVHYRSPNHLSPVKRELALKAGFPALSHAEDHAYSVKLQSLLKTEATIGPEPAYFYYFQPGKTAAEQTTR